MKKRKNNIYKPSNRSNNKKKHIIKYPLYHDISNPQSKDSKISDFFSFSPAPPPLPQQPTLPPTVKPKSTTTTHELVKNPSKPKLANDLFLSLHKFQTKASLTLLFNEHLTTKLHSLIEPLLNELNKTHSTEIINYININHILTKFILQFKTNFIYIPSYLQSNPLFDITYSTLALFQGFSNTKDLYLHYEPIDIQEAKITWPYIADTICNYVERYQSEKALYLYSPFNYVNDVAHIESICNFLGYKTIRIDETEVNKNYKLNKISEATRSQRIAILPEDVNNNLTLLETIVNSYSDKFTELNDIQQVNDMLYKDNTCISSNKALLLSSSSSRKSKLITTMKGYSSNSKIQSFFAMNTKENEIYKKIQNKLFQYCNQQKTLILIVDSFDIDHYIGNVVCTYNNNNEHKYLMNIIQKISGSKCPIIVLSNSMKLVSSIASTMFNRYFECKFNFMYSSSECKYIHMYLLEVVLFMHVLINKYMNVQYNNTKDVVEMFITQVNAFIEDDNMNLNLQRIKRISEFIWYDNNLDLGRCFVTMKQLFKRVEGLITNEMRHKDVITLLEKLTYDSTLIHANVYDNEQQQQQQRVKTLEQFVECVDNESFDDYVDGCVTSMANRRFMRVAKAKKLYYPDLTLSVNVERHLYNMHWDNEVKYALPLFCNVVDRNVVSFIRQQDIVFFTRLLNHYVSLSSLPFYHEILTKINTHSTIHQTLIERYNNIHKPSTMFHKFNDDIYFIKRTEMLRYAHFNLRHKFTHLNNHYN